MASEDPLPDRCGARVVDKVGLEVHDDELDETFVSSDRLVEVVLTQGAVTAHKEPEYEEVIGYLRKGFSLSAVILAPSEPSEDDDEDDNVRVTVRDDDPYVTNHDIELQGYCERYPMHGEDHCYVHQGGAPEGNQHAMKHGLKAKRSNYFKNLDDEDKRFVEALVDSWIDNAPFDRDNFAKVNEVYRIAVDQLRLWKAQDEFEDGMVYEQIIGTDDEGEPIEVEDENPANLPYDRLDRTTLRKLKELGCLDSPDDKQAEATESLAEKFAELAE